MKLPKPVTTVTVELHVLELGWILAATKQAAAAGSQIAKNLNKLMKKSLEQLGFEVDDEPEPKA